MIDITAGTTVRVKTAFGTELERVALGGVVMGHDFPVIWVAQPEDWAEAQRDGREPEALPWPAEDVTPVVDD